MPDRFAIPKQPRMYGLVSDRMMRSGQRVRVLRGEHEGRAGVVEALALDGVAVRLDAAGPRAPFVQVKVIAPGDLVRIQQSRLPSPRRAGAGR